MPFDLETYESIFLFYDGLLFVCGTFSNIIVLLTFGRSSVPKSSALILVLALAVGDLIACLVNSPLQMVAVLYSSSKPKWKLTNASKSTTKANAGYSDMLCQLSQGLLFFTVYFTLLLHGLMAVNRYFTVNRPLAQRMTRHQTKVLIAVILVLSAAIGIYGGKEGEVCESGDLSNTLELLFSITIVMVLVLITSANTIMLLKVRRQQRRVNDIFGEIRRDQVPTVSSAVQRRKPSIPVVTLQCQDIEHNAGAHMQARPEQAHHETFSVNRNKNCTARSSPRMEIAHSSDPSDNTRFRTIQIDISSVERSSRRSSLQPRRQRDITIYGRMNFHRKTLDNMTKILIATTIIFTLSWIPPIMIVVQISQNTLRDLYQNNYALFSFVVFLRDLPRLNHMINPVIYGLMSTKFRKEFKKLIKGKGHGGRG